MASSKFSPKVQEVVDSLGDEIPHLTQTTFTTGRGGMGNMMKNTDRAQSRRAQDVDDHHTPVQPVFSNKSIGRGGFGNLHAVTSSESGAKKAAKARGATADDDDDDEKKGLFQKVKKLFK